MSDGRKSHFPDVSVSVALSCGCRYRPVGPVPGIEAQRVGAEVICDRCDDYATVTRVTTRLWEVEG